MMPRTSGTRRGNGAGQGPGWGGGAKGAGSTAVIAPTFDVGNTAASVPFRDMSSVEAALALKDLLHKLAFTAENEAVRMNAADKLLDRIEGKPVARNLHVMAGRDASKMTDDELIEEISRAREARLTIEGD